MISFRRLSVVALLLTALPLTLSLPGCGGGSTSANSSASVYSATLQLNPTQAATVRLELLEPRVAGTFEVLAGSGAAPEFLPRGRYGFSGNFTSPSGFNAVGSLPSTTGFSLAGQLPVNTGNGVFTLTVNGVTVQGTFVRV